MKRIHKGFALVLGALLLLSAPLAALAYDVRTYDDLRKAAASTDTVINILADFSYDNGGAAVFTRQPGTTIEINGNNHTITGNDTVRLIEVNANVTIENLTLTHGNDLGGGGALLVTGNAEITNCTFTDNEAGSGGAVYVIGTVDIENSTFTGNSAASYGAIYSLGDISVTGSTFTDNQATYYGGAIFGYDNITIDNSIFTSNTAGAGGAVFSAGNDTITVTDSTFTDNIATSPGGAIYVQDNIFSPTKPTATIVGSTFTGNQAGHSGGGIYTASDVIIEDSTFEDNDATLNGGAIFVFGGADISGSTFDSNTAGAYGGAVLIGNGSSAVPDSTIRDSDFYDNRGTDGGSIYSARDLTMEGTNYFDGNTPASGNALNDPSGSIYMEASTGATLTVPDDNIILGRRPVPVSQPRGGSGGGPAPGRVASVPLTGQPARIGNCDAWVNVREGSTEDSDIIGRAYLGETIWLLQWNSDGTRCKALYNGRNNAGWVSGQFIIPQ